MCKMLTLKSWTWTDLHKIASMLHICDNCRQGCHQLNLIAGKFNREMALNIRSHYEDKQESINEENHSNHLLLHVELQ